MKILRNAKYGKYELHPKIVERYCQLAKLKLFVYIDDRYCIEKEKYKRRDITQMFDCYNPSGLSYSTKDLGEETNYEKLDENSFDVNKIGRNDKHLIEAVELYNLDKLQTENCRLEIVEIPNGVEWEIKNQRLNSNCWSSSKEIIVEKHRKW